jgi:hypothetical protein
MTNWQGLEEKFCKAEQDCFRARSLSEFYIIIFLNKLKYLQKMKKSKLTVYG